MTERERLIELLLQSKCQPEEAVYILADYLLKNGVIVPPCKVGDTVYVLENCSCFNVYEEAHQCHHRRTKATKYIDIVKLPTKHHTRCIKLFERKFKIEWLYKIGKTVFLTREEAEEALKARDNNA